MVQHGWQRCLAASSAGSSVRNTWAFRQCYELCERNLMSRIILWKLVTQPLTPPRPTPPAMVPRTPTWGLYPNPLTFEPCLAETNFVSATSCAPWYWESSFPLHLHTSPGNDLILADRFEPWHRFLPSGFVRNRVQSQARGKSPDGRISSTLHCRVRDQDWAAAHFEETT